MEKSFIEQLLQMLPHGTGLGIVGGIAMYLNKVRNGATFNIFMFGVNIFLAGWIGWLVFTMLPNTITFKIQITSISGFLSYPLLDLLEKKGVNLLIKKYLGKD